ncbi:MAG: hypothetical protein ACI9WU_000309 [Myxococcota bacterium]|jgi:hypothetical protein
MSISLSFLGENTKQKLDKIGLPDPRELMKLDRGRVLASKVLKQKPAAMGNLMKQGTGGAQVAKMLHQGFGNNAVANLINKSPLQDVKGHIPTSIGGALAQNDRRKRADELAGRGKKDDEQSQKQGASQKQGQQAETDALKKKKEQKKALLAAERQGTPAPALAATNENQKQVELTPAQKRRKQQAAMMGRRQSPTTTSTAPTVNTTTTTTTSKERTIPGMIGDAKNAAAANFNEKSEQLTGQVEQNVGQPLRRWGDKANKALGNHADRANKALEKPTRKMAGFGARLRSWGDRANSQIEQKSERVNQALEKPTEKMSGFGARLRAFGNQANERIDEHSQKANKALEKPTEKMAGFGARLRSFGDQANEKIAEHSEDANDVLSKGTPAVKGVGDSLRSWGDNANETLNKGAERANEALSRPTAKMQQAGEYLRDVGDRLNNGDRETTTTTTQTDVTPASEVEQPSVSPEPQVEPEAKEATPVAPVAPTPEVQPDAKQESQAPWVGPDTTPADESVLADDIDLGKFETPEQSEIGTSGQDSAQSELDAANSEQIVQADSTVETAAQAVVQPPSGAELNADPAVKGRSPAELGKATGGKEKKGPAPQQQQVPFTPPQKIAGGDINVAAPLPLPDLKSWKDRSGSGMEKSPVKVNLPAEHGRAGIGPGGEKLVDGQARDGQEPQKTRGQMDAEASQVGAEGERQLKVAEVDLGEEAKVEADQKETTAKKERDDKESVEKLKGDAQVAGEEEKGRAQRQAAESKGEQKKAQAQVEGEQKEGQIQVEGEAKRAAADTEKEQKIATENLRQDTEIATAKAETEAEEQKLRGKGAREQQQLEQEKAGKDAAARGKGSQDELASNRELEAEKSQIRSEGQRRADSAKSQGDRDAAAEMRRGQGSARDERNRGLREKRRLERQAEAKKEDQGWLSSAWNSIKSAVSGLINRAKGVWNAAKAAASRALNWAREKAQQIRSRASAAMRSAYSWADRATGGALSRAAAKVRQIRDAVASKLQEAAGWLRSKANALKEKVTGWVSSAWNGFKGACTRIKDSVVSAVNSAKDWCVQKYTEARAWVDEKVAAAKKWVSDKIIAAVSWVQQKYNEIASVVRAVVSAIVETVKAAVKAVWDHYAKLLSEIGTWLSEAWDKFSKWAQEAFVKFWNGPWRDVLIGIAVAVLIAAVTVATGGVGLIAIVAISAAATGAARMGGEVLARRASVAIKNDPDRAEAFQKEMEGLGDDATRWYNGVEKDEGWGDTIKAGAVEGARGAAEGAISGLVGGAGGALATRVAGGIAKAGAKEGAKLMARQGVQKAAEWGTRVAIDGGLSFAGDMGTGAINAELDIMTGKRTREEAYQFHVDRHLTPGAIGARMVGSGITGSLRMGSHNGANTSVQDGLVRKLVGTGADGATDSVRRQITRQVVDSSISGVENGMQGGLTSMANGGEFMDGFGPGFAGGMAGHHGRLAGEKYGRRFAAPAGGDVTVPVRGRNPGGDDDAPPMNPKLRSDLDVDETQRVRGDLDDDTVGNTPARIDDEPTIVQPKGRVVDPDPIVIPRKVEIQENQAQRLNGMRGKIEGLKHDVEVVPDSSPRAGQPGTMTVTEARRYVRTIAAMRKNPSGQEALAHIKNHDVSVTMERGVGSFNDGKRINIDPDIRGRHNRAGIMSHEAHHAGTQKKMPNPHASDRDGYVNGMLRNEAESQAQLFEYHRNQTSDGSREFGAPAYHTAYDAAAIDFRKKNPTATPDVVHAHAMEQGTVALRNEFGNAVPSTSIEIDPVTGQRRMKEGAPENYEQLYGGWHDDNSVVGKKAQQNAQTQETADPTRKPAADGDDSTALPATKQGADDLLTRSHGKAQDPDNPFGKKSEVGFHVPEADIDAAVVVRSRIEGDGVTPKAQNTGYRNRRHATQDLRDILNKPEIAAKIKNAAVGEPISLGIHETGTIRQGYHSVWGRDGVEVSFDRVSVAVRKKPDGSLHIVHYQPELEPRLKSRFDAEADSMEPMVRQLSRADQKAAMEGDLDYLMARPERQKTLYQMARRGLDSAKPKLSRIAAQFEGADGVALLKKNSQDAFITAVQEKVQRKNYGSVGDMGDMVRGRISIEHGADLDAVLRSVEAEFPGAKIDRKDGPYPRVHVDIELDNGVKFELQVGTHATTRFLEKQSVGIPTRLRQKVGLDSADYHIVKYDLLDKVKDPALRTKYGLDQLDADYNAALKATGSGEFDAAGTGRLSQRIEDTLLRIENDNPDLLPGLYTKESHTQSPAKQTRAPLPDANEDPRAFRKAWAETQQPPKKLPQDPDLYFTKPADSQEIPLSQLQNIRRREEGVSRGAIYMDGARRNVLPKRKPITVRQVGLDDQGQPIYQIMDGNSTFAIAKEHGWDSLRVVVEQPVEGTKPRIPAPEQEDGAAPVRQRTQEPTEGIFDGLVNLWPFGKKKSEGMPMPLTEPKVETRDNPDPVVKKEKGTHDAKYTRIKKEKLFNGEPKLEDVQQGAIGDCYLIAGMASVVTTRPDLVKNMFQDHGDGTVTVTLFTDPSGKVVGPNTPGATGVPIRVTTELPSINGKSTTYAAAPNGVLWPGLLEKAYASHMGGSSYDKIGHGGYTDKAMEAITGGRSRTKSTSYGSDAEIQGEIRKSLDDGHPLSASSQSTNTVKNNAELKKLMDSKQVFANHAYTIIKLEDGLVHLYNPWGSRHPKPLTVAEFRKLYHTVQTNEAPPRGPAMAAPLRKQDSVAQGASPTSVVKQPLRATLDELLASPAAQKALYKTAQEGLAEAKPKVDAIIAQFEGANGGAMLKRNGVEAFTAAVEEKVRRKSYPDVGQMGDAVRGRISMESGADVNASLVQIGAAFPKAVFDIKTDSPYPRIHVDIELENGVRFELQVGTHATTRMLEQTMVPIPGALHQKVGLTEADFHVAKYDIVDKIKDPTMRAKYGLDDFDARYNDALRKSGTGDDDSASWTGLATDLGAVMKKIEADDPAFLQSLYTKDSHAPAPVKAAPEQTVGMPMRTEETDADPKAPSPSPKSKTIENPDPVTVHDGKKHEAQYKDVGDDLFNGKPKLEDVQQGYLADCFLVAAMGAVAKQRPDIIQRMFVDHGDGTVTVTLHTMKSGWLVPFGTAGSTEHNIRVKKDLPVNGSASKPTYAKGKDGQLWPGLLEKAYVHLKAKGEYQGVNKGGHTTDALETITGSKARSFKSVGKTDEALLIELTKALADKKPVASGSFSKNDIKTNETLKKMATDRDVAAWHAYVVDDVKDGLIYMKNPWGKRHPKPLTPEQYKTLYPNTYIGDTPPMKTDVPDDAKLKGKKTPAPDVTERIPMSPDQVVDTPLRAHIDDLLASPEGQRALYKTAEAGLAEAKPKVDAIIARFEGADGGAMLKRSGVEAFVAAVEEKCRRKNYPNVGRVGDAVRGRISMESGADVNKALAMIEASFPKAEFDIKTDSPYPRIHVDIELENGVRFELQVGTHATTRFLEKTLVSIPSALHQKVGLTEADFHVAKYDIVDKIQDPALRAKYGLDEFDARYNDTLRKTGTGESDETVWNGLAADLGIVMKRIEADDPEYLQSLYTKDSHAPAPK